MKLLHLTFSALFVTGITLSPVGHAGNLLETFKLAQQNDPQWSAKKAHFLSDKERVEQAKGMLRPSAALSVSWSNINTDAPTGEVDQAPGYDCAIGFGAVGNLTGNNQVSGSDLALLRRCGDFVQEITDALTLRSVSYNRMNYTLQAKQPLFRLDYWYQNSAALSALSAAQANLASAQQDLIMRSAEGYFNVLKTQEDLKLARSEQKTLQIALSELKNRYKVGLLRDTDVYETQASYDLATAAVIIAQSEHDNAKQLLAMMTGEQEVMATPLPSDIPIEPPKPNAVGDWEDYARKGNLTLLASRFAVNANRQMVTAKRSEHAPTVDLGAQYAQDKLSGDRSTESKATTVGVSINIPLFAGGITSSQERQARFNLQEAEDNQELALRNALRETRQYHTRVNADVAAVQARNKAIRSAASAYRSMKLGYENGVRTVTDVLATQRKLYQARKDLTESRYLYIVDTLRLKKSAGMLASEDLETLNSWLNSSGPQAVQGEELGGLTMDEIDGIKLKAETKVFGVKPKQSEHKSLYDAYKAWKSEDAKPKDGN
ncbi:Type I secretion outer membrane efflux protein [gamma proteobacterium HdN1]|nr:Type I secretion outer membrane efflux protein [gamma proteobacterium HdN1]